MNSKNLGIAFFVIGILLLFFTFYLAYGLYEYVIGNQQMGAVPSSPTASGNSSVNNIVQAVTSSIIGSIPINRYAAIFLGILVLYALANISYKIAKLGIEMLRSVGDDGAKQKSK
ncbi:MAG: hypothetical protein ACP5UH_00820 [Candidatus Micrarchaeia archaeon]